MKPVVSLAAFVPFAVAAMAAACDPLVNDPKGASGSPSGSSGNPGGSGSGGDISGNASGGTSGSASGSSAGASSGMLDDSGVGSGGAASGMDMPAIDSGNGIVDGALPPACPAPTTPYSPGTGLPSAGWTGTASMTATTDLSADSIAKAFDGDITTRWASGRPQNASNGEFYQLDLGAATTISQVLIYLGGTNSTDFPVTYEVRLSTDGTTYTSPVATGAGSAPLTPICFRRQSARYIKITETGTAALNWWAVYEIQVIP